MSSLLESSLRENDYDKIKQIAKSDLHNHGSNGGRLSYLNQYFGKEVQAPSERFVSIEELEWWITKKIGCEFPGKTGYCKRIEAAFVQCHEDGIKVLCMSFTLEEIKYWGNISNFMFIINKIRNKYADDIVFYPEISLKWDCDVEKEMELLETIIDRNWFCSIDICGREDTDRVQNFKELFRKAKQKGFCLRAHVGEFGAWKNIMHVINVLELDEVNHGISICNEKSAMKYCAEQGIWFHVCPGSNIMMGRVKNYKEHPIREMFHEGMKVTINSDDCLIFNQSVTDEYVNLFKAGTLSAYELEQIRKYGLEKGNVL